MAKDNLKRTPSGFPIDPQINALERQLSRLAAQWRSCKDKPCPEYVREYHRVYQQLRDLGWDDYLDVDSELPDELMPPGYFDR